MSRSTTESSPTFALPRPKRSSTRVFRRISSFTVLKLALLVLRAVKDDLRRNPLRLRPLWPSLVRNLGAVRAHVLFYTLRALLGLGGASLVSRALCDAVYSKFNNQRRGIA